MTDTSSFSINNEIYTNRNCYHHLISSIKHPDRKCSIILESYKLNPNYDKALEYLKDLQNYFNFTIIQFEDKSKIELLLGEFENTLNLTLLCMFLRYLYEGNNEAMRAVGYDIQDDHFEQDSFHLILPVYFKFKNLFTNEDVYQNLAIATNWFVLYSHSIDNYYNSNHFPVARKKIMALEVKDIKYSVNSGVSITTADKFENLNTSLNDDQDYIDFYQSFLKIYNNN